jgi:hypothetical protein
MQRRCRLVDDLNVLLRAWVTFRDGRLVIKGYSVCMNKRRLFSSVPLHLSRACLGKVDTLIDKRKKENMSVSLSLPMCRALTIATTPAT